MKYSVCLALVVALTACVNKSKAPEEKPRAGTAAVATAPAGAEQAQAPEPEPVRLVHLRVNKADLVTEVLPAFKEQAGVDITWTGEPKEVTLRMTQPMAWEDALDLVCQFTNTHAKLEKNRIILRKGWLGQSVRGEKLKMMSGRGEPVLNAPGSQSSGYDGGSDYDYEYSGGSDADYDSGSYDSGSSRPRASAGSASGGQISGGRAR